MLSASPDDHALCPPYAPADAAAVAEPQGEKAAAIDRAASSKPNPAATSLSKPRGFSLTTKT